jgi:integrase
MPIDIHRFDEQFAATAAHVAQSDISERNKELIRSYCDACLLRQTCGKVRLIRVMVVLTLLARSLRKDFDTATREDLEQVLGGLLRREPRYSVETISTYKRILRRFMTYVVAPAEFPHVKSLPDHVAWISGHIPRRERPMIQRADLLTPADVEQLIACATGERDQAFIAGLWEAGPRIGEIGGMHIKDATPVVHGYVLSLNGKTGSRTPMVVSSAPYLARWLAKHPRRDDPNAPLWVDRTRRPLTYDAFLRLLQRLFRRAGIKKPAHPHIFRHSRVTYVLANGLMNEQQAKIYFGWSADSDVIGSTYAHLTDMDANNAVLRENNLMPHQEHHQELQPRKCHICGQLNAPRSEYCQRCQAVLDLKKAYEHQQLHDAKEQLLRSMFRVLVEKGLVDEAAHAVHDANLSATLKMLAEHVRGERTITDRIPSQTATPSVKQTPAA